MVKGKNNKNNVISRACVCVCIYIYIYINRSGLIRVSPGQLPDGFLLKPGPVPSPGRPGLGSTRRAGPGFKTMIP